MQLTQAVLDTLRANNASTQELLADVEPTPDTNPLQAQLDEALGQVQALTEANSTLQAIIDESRTLAQAILAATGPGA